MIENDSVGVSLRVEFSMPDNGRINPNCAVAPIRPFIQHPSTLFLDQIGTESRWPLSEKPWNTPCPHHIRRTFNRICNVPWWIYSPDFNQWGSAFHVTGAGSTNGS